MRNRLLALVPALAALLLLTAAPALAGRLAAGERPDAGSSGDPALDRPLLENAPGRSNGPSAPSRRAQSLAAETPASRRGTPPPGSGLDGPATDPARPRGILGGMLGGGILGSLLFGGPQTPGVGFAGPGFLDLLLIGGGIFLLMRWLKTRSEDQKPDRPTPSDFEFDDAPPPADDPDQTPEQRRDAANRYARAQAGWDMLRSRPGDPAGQPSPAPGPDPVAAPETGPGTAREGLPAGFDQAEFLRGAKAVYARILAARDARDLDTLRHFTTDGVFARFERENAQDRGTGPTDILLIDASLLGVQEEGDLTRASVLYDALLRTDPRQDRPAQVKETWHFVRQGNGFGSTWRLDGMEPVQ